MRRFLAAWLLAIVMAVNLPALAGSITLVKVLPEFLDLKGRNSVSPSLYERDSYQVILRDHPERRSGIRFYIQWKTTQPIWEPMLARVELRGIAEGKLPRKLVLEEPMTNRGGVFTHWTEVTLAGESYKQFGAVTAWRVTLWEGQTLVGQQQSFLW